MHPDADLEAGEARRHVQRKAGNGSLKDLSPPPDQPSARQLNGTSPGGDDSEKTGRNGRSTPPSKPATEQPGENGSMNPSPEEAIAMSVFQSPAVQDPDPAAQRLARNETPLSRGDFQTLMGLREPTADRSVEFPFKLAIKGGLYGTIHHEFESVQYRYRIFNIATYALLALQVIIGAIFIILGALRNPRIYIAISVLGAISTAVGGALALMKGQGLPNRLREARNRLRNVIFEAEEIYWDFQSGRSIIYSDVKKLREDYLRVVEEMRRNHPDTWTDAATEAAQANRMKR